MRDHRRNEVILKIVNAAADQIAAAHFSGKPQPSILLNQSNIAWFGDTIALPQHLQISQMRALETGRGDWGDGMYYAGDDRVET